jgi:hypothetical protein
MECVNLETDADSTDLIGPVIQYKSADRLCQPNSTAATAGGEPTRCPH